MSLKKKQYEENGSDSEFSEATDTAAENDEEIII